MKHRRVVNVFTTGSTNISGCTAEWEGEGKPPRKLQIHTRHAYKKPSPFLTSRQPGLIHILMTGILLLLSLVISMSNMIHFVGGFNGLTKMHAVDMNHSSSSVVFRRRLSLSGSRNLARNQNLLQNVAYEKQFNRSQVVMFDLARTGSEDSLPGIN